MSAKSICDMGLTQTAEFISALGRAGFDADLAQRVINARGNKLALAMHATLSQDQLNSRFESVKVSDYNLLDATTSRALAAGVDPETDRKSRVRDGLKNRWGQD